MSSGAKLPGYVKKINRHSLESSCWAVYMEVVLSSPWLLYVLSALFLPLALGPSVSKTFVFVFRELTIWWLVTGKPLVPG